MGRVAPGTEGGNQRDVFDVDKGHAEDELMPPTEPMPVDPPKHPLHALTTYELRDRRRELERAIKGIAPDAPVQADLRRQLDAVLTEQEERTRVARA